MAANAGTRDRPKALLSWSSGKDSAWALHVLRQQRIEVVGLLTTVTEGYRRVAMHATRLDLLDAQARATGLPVWPVPIPSPCTNDEYEAAMARVLERATAAGVSALAFGDLFLEDIRRYREERLASTDITPLFPLWGLPTLDLARDMIRAGAARPCDVRGPAPLVPHVRRTSLRRGLPGRPARLGRSVR